MLLPHVLQLYFPFLWHLHLLHPPVTIDDWYHPVQPPHKAGQPDVVGNTRRLTLSQPGIPAVDVQFPPCGYIPPGGQPGRADPGCQHGMPCVPEAPTPGLYADGFLNVLCPAWRAHTPVSRSGVSRSNGSVRCVWWEACAGAAHESGPIPSARLQLLLAMTTE
eukprot:gene12330-biopygen7932